MLNNNLRPFLRYFDIPFLLTIMLWGCYAVETPAQVPMRGVPAVRVEQVSRLSHAQPKKYVGTVVAKEMVTIIPRVSGYLEKILFQEGATVQKGDVLFEMEDKTYQVKVQIAQAVVRQIEAEIALASRNLERTLTLRQGSVVSEQDADEAKRTIALHEAKLDEAKSHLEQAKIDLAYTKIHAPLTGRIGTKNFSEGNYITPNSGTLVSIVQYDPIRVRLLLTEADFMNYLHNYFQKNETETKNKVEIIRPNGEPYVGEFKFEFLNNLVNSRSDTITVFLECQNEKMQLLPGGYVKIAISEEFEKPLPAVNVNALMTDRQQRYVYVVAEGNQIERRDVTVGPQVYGKQAILSGLKTGETVVIGGMNKVKPGVTVRPVPAT